MKETLIVASPHNIDYRECQNKSI